MTDRVVIAGGGIGGLATAIGLAQKGIASVVLEKASELGEIGAGIQLGPNAFHAFDTLGVGDRAREMAVYIDNLRLMDALSGDEITRIPLDGAFRERFGNPYAVVHRGDLHGVFLQACRDHPLVDLRTSAGVVGYEQDADTASAILDTGERVSGRALIGADGLWSKIRAQLVGDGPPRVSGHTTLPVGHPDRTDARGPALERRHALGRAEMPYRALPAVGLEAVQPCGHLSQRRPRACRRSTGRS